MSAELLRRIFPFLRWPRPDRDLLMRDLMAGLAVAMLSIPQSLAYAQVAGVPAYLGLYAAFLPTIIGVLFGSSALLSTGPAAMSSLFTAAAVGAIVVPHTESYPIYVTLLALMCGLIQIALGLARAGFLMNLLSHPVMAGFTNAAALVIALSQVPNLLGIEVPHSDTFVETLQSLLMGLPGLHLPSAAIGVGGIVLLVVLRRWLPRLPAYLLLVVLGTAISHAIDFGARGGGVVGEIPRGLPQFSVPTVDWYVTLTLMPAAFLLALVSFMEVATSSKAIARKTQTRWDENQELIGQGLAKVASAFSQSIPVSGSISRSALNLAAGGRSGWSSITAAVVILLALVTVGPMLSELPKPALAAMIIVAVSNLFDLRTMRSAWLAGREDGIAALLTFGLTLAFAPRIEVGILAGVLFALGAFVWRRMIPRVAILEPDDDGGLREVDKPRPGPDYDEIVALRFDAALFFANVAYFESRILRQVQRNPRLRFILLSAQGINYIDASAVEMMRGLLAYLKEHDVTLVVSGVKRHIYGVAQNTGLVDMIGLPNFYATDRLALRALREKLADARIGPPQPREQATPPPASLPVLPGA